MTGNSDRNIFESYFNVFDKYKYQKFFKKHNFLIPYVWKSRYIIIQREPNSCPVLYIYKNINTTNLVEQFDITSNVTFRKRKINSKYFVLDVCFLQSNTMDTSNTVRTPKYSNDHENCPSLVLTIFTTDLQKFHLLNFFLLAQFQLKSEICMNQRDHLFLVRLLKSENIHQLGITSYTCLMHICDYGIVLSLQQCKNVIGYWSWKSIECYEFSEENQFSFSAGYHSRGSWPLCTYKFDTRHNKNTEIFKICNDISRNVRLKGVYETTPIKYTAILPSQDNFESHLRRVSRGIYDEFEQYFGTLRASRRAQNTYENGVGRSRSKKSTLSSSKSFCVKNTENGFSKSQSQSKFRFSNRSWLVGSKRHRRQNGSDNDKNSNHLANNSIAESLIEDSPKQTYIFPEIQNINPSNLHNTCIIEKPPQITNNTVSIPNIPLRPVRSNSYTSLSSSSEYLSPTQ
ncbi:hypothetical protein A3Q56_04650 [Intoshia linei]|uniref:IRS-type PTB domain-containing protein n=1 Tax=Intoshia linei TaxID=1819745 RepID=A0A177B007_9BILA|nr:hypothetical protein A3Q56_04650 [Intoshia linei]